VEALQGLKFIAAFVFVLSLMALLGWLGKRYGVAGVVQSRGGKRRLQILEQLPLDGRRRAVLLRRDDQVHLIVTGPDGDMVVETGIPHEDIENIVKIVENAA